MSELWSELRAVASKVRSGGKKAVRFPGWDFENSTPELAHSIRNAAVAVLNNTDYDSSIFTTYEDLANLITYIADMLEE